VDVLLALNELFWLGVTGDSQLGDVKSVTGVSQFGDSHNLSTNDIFQPYTSRMCLHLAKFIVENNF